MHNWPDNGGAESLVRLPSGGFFVISETAHWPKSRNRIAIRFDGDPIAAPRRGFRFGLVVPAGFSPSDTTLLPDGRLLVLLRRRSEEHTSELQSLMRISYAVFCLKKQKATQK